MRIFWVTAIVAALALTINSWLFWPLLPVFWVASQDFSPQKIYLLALLTGLLADLLLGRTLGTSSLFLLLGCALLYGYRLFWRMPTVGVVVLAIVLSFLEKILWV